MSSLYDVFLHDCEQQHVSDVQDNTPVLDYYTQGEPSVTHKQEVFCGILNYTFLPHHLTMVQVLLIL